jgi:DNA-directed RNA polymerase specialized sigma subunit
MAKKRNYVNNKDLLQALIDYKKKVKEAEDQGDPLPRIPEYIGECIFLIANRLATKPNFSGYTYKDDMISDGIENCIQYIHNFNPDKSENPFAYFTQIIWYAFLRRIQKEKKQMYIKFKSSQNMMLETEIMDSGDNSIQLSSPPEYINEFVNEFEEKMAGNKKEKAK